MIIEAAKRKEFDVIYVWKINRLFRNTLIFNDDETPKYNWNNPYYNWKLEGSIFPGEYYLIIIYGSVSGDMIAKNRRW